MSDYILPHSDPLEDDRLMVMSKMLDPHMRFRLSLLGPLEGWKCLEVGAGNGTMSQWLADQVGHDRNRCPWRDGHVSGRVRLGTILDADVRGTARADPRLRPDHASALEGNNGVVRQPIFLDLAEFLRRDQRPEAGDLGELAPYARAVTRLTSRFVPRSHCSLAWTLVLSSALTRRGGSTQGRFCSPPSIR